MIQYFKLTRFYCIYKENIHFIQLPQKNHLTQIVWSVLACKEWIKPKEITLPITPNSKDMDTTYREEDYKHKCSTQDAANMDIKVSRPTLVQCFHGPCAESYKENPVHEQSHIRKSSWRTEVITFANLQAFFMSSSVALWRNFFKPRTA
jgi:hypothetical protein